jgi:hypothetical protein
MGDPEYTVVWANYGIRESSYDYRDIRDDRVNTYFRS